MSLARRILSFVLRAKRFYVGKPTQGSRRKGSQRILNIVSVVVTATLGVIVWLYRRRRKRRALYNAETRRQTSPSELSEYGLYTNWHQPNEANRQQPVQTNYYQDPWSGNWVEPTPPSGSQPTDWLHQSSTDKLAAPVQANLHQPVQETWSQNSSGKWEQWCVDANGSWKKVTVRPPSLIAIPKT